MFSTISLWAGSLGVRSRRNRCTLRIIHLSDIHIWHLDFRPHSLFGKRAIGMIGLVAGRARKFRLERLLDVVARVRSLEPDHVLITGDLSTTALPAEFLQARHLLGDLLQDPSKATVIPGNHDRYTTASHHRRSFETYFGDFSPEGPYPWLRRLDGETAVLGLDPTRPHLTARGRLPHAQLERAKGLFNDATNLPSRLIVACHYPLFAPSPYEKVLHRKRLSDPGDLISWLGTLGPHLYCCGHVHAPWAFFPVELPQQLCLNSGAPLLRDHTGHRPPGFLQIDLIAEGLIVLHHAWNGNEWMKKELVRRPRFFTCDIGDSLRESI